MTAFTVLSFSACQEWGEIDPPAGNQVYPKLEQVAKITFEDGTFDPTSFNYYAYDGGEVAVVEEDATQGNVLHLPNGYARLFNPLNNVKVQNGVSLTFLVKQVLLTDEETGKQAADDLEGALFSFQNENGTQRMFLTANGWLKYEAADGEYEANNPQEYKTGMMGATGEWHYVALKVCNDGYTVFVDGMKKVEKTETKFDFSKIVQFMASVPYIYIGNGSDTNTREMWVDDLSIYRNQITKTEWTDPRKPASGGNEEDYRNYITVGAEDFSSGWWTTFSDLVKFKKSAHFGFYNYGSGANNWNNWNIVVTNGKAVGEDGYAEYFVLRSDAYGWNPTTNTNDTPALLNIAQDFDFTTFIADMQGAYVDLTLTRAGNIINLRAVITTTAGTEYTYTAMYDDTNYGGGLPETLGAFFVCDGSYFKFDVEEVYTEGESYSSDKYLVGSDDCSTPFWNAFSKNYVITGNNEYPFGFVFTNNNNNGANWNNWLTAVTHGAPLGDADYTEYFVLRSDAYGWGDGGYNADNISHGFNFDTFVADMKASYVRLFFTRSNENLNIKAKIRTAEGKTLDDYKFSYSFISTPEVGIFLTVELASLDILKVGYFPFADKIEK